MNEAKPTLLEESAARGLLPELLSQYLESCRLPPDAPPKKTERVFPNLAGFCRFLGCGTTSADTLRTTHPELADRICAVLEDEALNASVSPTVLSAYLKRRLGYADKPDPPGSAADCGQLRLIFEHDILEDGE